MFSFVFIFIKPAMSSDVTVLGSTAGRTPVGVPGGVGGREGTRVSEGRASERP